jgi:hypothetical protein
MNTYTVSTPPPPRKLGGGGFADGCNMGLPIPSLTLPESMASWPCRLQSRGDLLWDVVDLPRLPS